MRIYTIVYNYSVAQLNFSIDIKDANRPFVYLSDEEAAIIHVRRRDALYSSLSAYLKEALSAKCIEAKVQPRDNLLDYYNREWDRFVTCGKFNHYTWIYLHQYWYLTQARVGRRGIYSVFNLHLKEWKMHMLDPMHEDLSAALLEIVRKQRDGEYVEHLPKKSFVSSICKCFRLPTDKKSNGSVIVTLSRCRASQGEDGEMEGSALSQRWDDTFRDSTVEYYKAVVAEEMAEGIKAEKYIDRVCRKSDTSIFSNH
jgi:hypothetical protein